MIVYIEYDKITGMIKSVFSQNYQNKYTKIEINKNFDIFSYKYLNGKLIELTEKEKESILKSIDNEVKQ